MYEGETYEVILQRLLDRVSDGVDKREGSIIYDALAPAAVELAQTYETLEAQLGLFFAETTFGTYLDRKALESGITPRKPATKSLRKGRFKDGSGAPFDVPAGSRYGLDGIVYVARERVSQGVFHLECEAVGSIGNQSFGALLPIDYVPGLGSAELSDVLTPGDDVETDDSLRQRLLQHIRNPSASGNAADYLRWAMEVSGVGAAQVYPLWAGAGTVKVVIADVNKQPGGAELIADVASHIGNVRPIGADVTVEAAVGVGIDIVATIVLAPGYSVQQVTEAYKEAIVEHLKSIAFVDSYVAIARVGNLLLTTPGVIDYSGLTLNGGTVNIALGAGQIPVLGSISLGV
ncbi:baseplate J/gp47 family protein [Paenibacillus sp.]|uniref:baseplate J/gp47 family protein n=1 Tax=Paenibacillus sp. TaxID=58172 RepID=UPI002811FA39|nr:baseplate J/gp47 family protein [Paenibacillus sp.]